MPVGAEFYVKQQTKAHEAIKSLFTKPSVEPDVDWG